MEFLKFKPGFVGGHCIGVDLIIYHINQLSLVIALKLYLLAERLTIVCQG